MTDRQSRIHVCHVQNTSILEIKCALTSPCGITYLYYTNIGTFKPWHIGVNKYKIMLFLFCFVYFFLTNKQCAMGNGHLPPRADWLLQPLAPGWHNGEISDTSGHLPLSVPVSCRVFTATNWQSFVVPGHSAHHRYSILSDADWSQKPNKISNFSFLDIRAANQTPRYSDAIDLINWCH